MLDSREWIVPDGATSSTTDALETVIEKNLISLRNIFHCFRLVLAKHIAIETINNVHKPGYLSHKEYKYPSPTTMKSMAVFISSKWCAFKEQHFHAG